MTEYDCNFNNSFDFCVEEMHEEDLDWAYESSAPMTIDLIASGIEKSRVSLELPTFLKTFNFWKTLTKKENLPLPPVKRMLPMHH